MKKHTRNLLILSIACCIIAFIIMIIFLQPAYQRTSGFAGGLGMFCVCLYYFIKIWKTRRNKDEEEALEIKLADERSTKIMLHAYYMAFQIFLALMILAALVALYFHYELLANTLVICCGGAFIIYGICFCVYRKIY